MIRVGLIGCGNIGRVHAQCLSRISGAKIVAFADAHEPAAKALCEEFGGEYATGDPMRVLRDDRIDAVYICTRHDSHASLAIAAANAGKHLFLEKPVALTAAECVAVAEAVERAGVFAMPAFKLRFYSLVRRAKAFLPNPQVLVGQMMDQRWPDEAWAQDPVQGGANVLSQGCHTTDLLRYFAGVEAAEVFAAGGAMSHPGHPCIDQCVATIRFAGGTVGSWVQGDAAMGEFTGKIFFQLFGHGRSVQLYNRLTAATFSDGDKTWTETAETEEGFQLENDEFIAALNERRPPSLTLDDGIRAMEIVFAADRAIRTGEVQRLSAAPTPAGTVASMPPG
jgi:predicted dehydrogenase